MALSREKSAMERSYELPCLVCLELGFGPLREHVVAIAVTAYSPSALGLACTTCRTITLWERSELEGHLKARTQFDRGWLDLEGGP